MKNTHHKSIKRSLLWFLGSVLFFSGVLFLISLFDHTSTGFWSHVGLGSVYADNLNQGNGTAQNDMFKSFAQLLDTLLKVLYILLWPLLVIAGQSLSNDMVYGTIFNLDVSLFKFWNMMRNFAFFIIGFMFLYYILRYIISSDEKFNPKNIIPKMLIAGVLVQASRWLIGVLLDLSTIATYAVGGLPLTVVQGDNVGQNPVLETISSMKINDILNVGSSGSSSQDYKMYYAYGSGTTKQQFLNCIIRGEKLMPFTWQAVQFEGLVSSTANSPFSNSSALNFGPLPSTQSSNGQVTVEDVCKNEASTPFKPVQFNSDYCVLGSQLVKYTCGLSTTTGSAVALADGRKYLATTFPDGITVGTLLERGKGLVGPFYALYGSLLNMGALNLTAENKTVGGFSLEFIIKALIGFGLMIPLLALAIILIMRVAFLRLVIAFAPILVIVNVMDIGTKSVGKFTISGIMSLIFLPVIVTFAVSLSLIFLSALQQLNVTTTDQGGSASNAMLNAFGVSVVTGDTSSQSCYNILGLTTLCLGKPLLDGGFSPFLDTFTRFILNLFGVGLMRTIVFMALKSSDFFSKTVNSIQEIGQGLIKSAPIIPIAGGRSIGGVSQGLKNVGQTIPQGGNVISQEASALQKHFEGGDKPAQKPETTATATDTTTPTQTTTSTTSSSPTFVAPSATNTQALAATHINSTNANDFKQALGYASQAPVATNLSPANLSSGLTNYVGANIPSLRNQTPEQVMRSPEFLHQLHSRGFTPTAIEQIYQKVTNKPLTQPEKKLSDEEMKKFLVNDKTQTQVLLPLPALGSNAGIYMKGNVVYYMDTNSINYVAVDNLASTVGKFAGNTPSEKYDQQGVYFAPIMEKLNLDQPIYDAIKKETENRKTPGYFEKQTDGKVIYKKH